MGKRFFLFLVWGLISAGIFSCTKVDPPAPVGPVPSENQFAWHKLEYYGFIHFNMNTFTGIEWGNGGEDPALFNPAELDCRQWARIARDAGMKGLIITAKHHDGFCLWPTSTTEHSVKSSPWRDGKGDVIRELADACREYGLKMGVYLSPWDRNYAGYGHPEYIPVFREQLRELLTSYGEIFEVWFDGANGGTGWYGGANEQRVIDAKTYYEWPVTYQMIRELQPKAVIFADAADIRWVGNEEGWARPTNWSTLNKDAFNKLVNYDPETLRSGEEDGTDWVPAEVDVSIRPGWYYRPSEDHQVKTLSQLLKIYYESVGRNGNLLLNIPVDFRGLVHEKDEAALMGLASALKADFATDLAAGRKTIASNVRGKAGAYCARRATDGKAETYWATDDDVVTASLTVDFGKETSFNRFLVMEFIPLGQRVKKFTLEAFSGGQWVTIAEGTTIGYKRILRLPQTSATQIRFNILDAKGSPLISTLQVFNAPKVLEPPVINRNRDGVVSITAADPNTEISYTTDGSIPLSTSTFYDSPFPFSKKGVVSAIVFDPDLGGQSDVTMVTFDIPSTRWRLLGEIENHSGATAPFDGDQNSALTVKSQLPYDFIIDLGEEVTLTGFTYLPDQGRWDPGVISNYELYVSKDSKSWGGVVSAGEFGNIRNSPILQRVEFDEVFGRFLRFRALSDVSGEMRAGIAEFGVITK